MCLTRHLRKMKRYAAHQNIMTVFVFDVRHNQNDERKVRGGRLGYRSSLRFTCELMNSKTRGRKYRVNDMSFMYGGRSLNKKTPLVMCTPSIKLVPRSPYTFSRLIAKQQKKVQAWQFLHRHQNM